MHPKDQSLPLKQQLQGINIYLIGMMGCGKSSVGPELAKLLGYRFIDADSVIAAAAGCSISEIFDSQGEAGFRLLETQVLHQISQWHSLVVATGGGVVTTSANWGALRQGLVVWLQVDAAQLLARLQGQPGDRPMLQKPNPETELLKLLQARAAQYSQADLSIAAGCANPAQVAAEIVAALPTVLKAPGAPRTTAP
ncbi:shikimate kinase [Synechococcus sp. UW140]|uniref:shikimate kinase n=1 Tax=Synechococcus sp. UW140 TaxID=368503 RepID=UPI0025D9CFCF|nr:shikimate kinase [Synechococcus sp. UW140]